MPGLAAVILGIKLLNWQLKHAISDSYCDFVSGFIHTGMEGYLHFHFWFC